MKENYLTFYDGDLLPKPHFGIETKHLLGLLEKAMKESGSTKELHQVVVEPKPNKEKYKYLLIGC